MRKYIILTLLVIFTCTCIGFLFSKKAEAIPYFARKYNTQCTMCHVQSPLLNSTGETFKQNGYRLKGEEGEFIWQNKLFPISGRVVFNYKMLNRKGGGWGSEGGTQSIFFIDEMEFFSSGTLAPNVSYFLDFGSRDEEAFAPGVAFIIFDDILPEGKGNIKAGKFYNEFLYLSDKRRLTLEHYMAPVTRTQYGVEFNGEIQPAGVRYSLGVANDETTREKAGQTETNFKSISNYVRAFYAWTTYSLSGHTLGLRGYTAKAGEEWGKEKDHTQFDLSLNLHLYPVIFNLGYYIQSNVYDPLNNEHFDQDNLLTELILRAGPKLLINLRYETQDRDDIEDSDNRYLLNGSYYVAPNIDLIGEYVKQEGKESQKDEDKFQVGVQLVF